MNVLDQFVQQWKQRFPDLLMSRCRIVLAVSGGVDSVVLADLLDKAGIDFIIVHCNFQLRGEESTRDEAFVKALGEKYSKTVLIKHFDTNAYAQQEKFSIQEAARVLRYSWFKEIVCQENSQYATQHIQHKLATAHHANDNIETLLINFFRGTGIGGLHGILPLQADLIRPLLFAKREEILAYAAANGLTWVEDSSNTSEKYTRNFFRLQLLPAVKTVFPQAEDNLLHNIERFGEIELLYRQSVDLQLKKLVTIKEKESHIPVLKLLKTPAAATLLWEILQPFAFSAAQVAEVLKLAEQGANSSYVASATHRAIKNRNWLIIAPLPAAEAQHIVIEAKDTTILFRDGVMHFKTLPHQPSDISHPTSDMALLDAGKIQFPLLLRPWKQGDYFYPLGMEKKKKLSKFLIAQKLSATRKEKVWVLEMNQKIIWIAGIRIDNRFKITPATQTCLQISVSPPSL